MIYGGLKNNETLIIATDGIVMYIWGAYYSFKQKTEEVTEAKMKKISNHFKTNKIESFTAFINELKTSLTSNKTFRDYTKHCFSENELPNDDYTVAFIIN